MEKDEYLTPSQLTFILVGIIIGISVLILPLGVVQSAKQDGWIACILGAVYPIYLVLFAQCIQKKFPKQTILMISEKYYGRFLGTILNLIFVSFFLLVLTEVASGITNVLLIYMTWFLTPYKILITILLLPAFVAYKGVKTLGKMSEVVFYLTFILFFIPIAAFKEGSILNIMPVFGSGIISIVKGTKETILAYSGIEILFLLYPFVTDIKKVKKCGITAVVIICIIYTWCTFATIFYLGPDIVGKFLWPVVTVTEAITIPIINSFRYIFMSLYTILMIRTMSTCYYAFAFGLSEITKIANRKSFVILMYPLIFYLSTKYGNPTTRRGFLDKITPIYVIYNVIYISTIALLITMKKGENCEEKLQP